MANPSSEMRLGQPGLWRLAVMSGLAAVLLSWPMLLTTAPLGYFDTLGYYEQGEAAIALLRDQLGLVPETATGGGGAGTAETGDGVRVLRAPAYTLFAYLTALTPVGLILTVWLQTAITLFAFGLLVAARPSDGGAPRTLALAVAVSLFSTLPWMASYAMPDILGAALVLFYMCIAGPMERLGRAGLAVLTLIACFAVAAHYGNIPLAGALAAIALALRAVERRPVVLAGLAAVLPVVAAVLVNMAASTAATGTAEVAPKRLPILLSRSIEDGPALWHLQSACETDRYAICAAFDEIPETVSAFLWADTGIASLTADELDTLRREEKLILWNAFRDYPLAQTWALTRNALLQLLRVGTGEMLPLIAAPEAPSGLGVAEQDSIGTAYFGFFDWLTKLVTYGAFIWLCILWARGRIVREDRHMLIVLIAALLLNAAIFGGLSYPVDRYQSRIAWLVPAFLALLLARPGSMKESTR